MADIGASIEAYLKLNITNFVDNAKKAIGVSQNLDKEFNKVGSGGLNNLGNGFSKLGQNISSFGSQSGNVLSTFGKQLNEARAHTDSFGNSIATQSQKANAAMSSMFPGDVFSKQLGLGRAAVTSFGATGTAAARSLRQEWATASAQASQMGRNAKAAYPLEQIWNTQKAQASLNQQVLTTSGSFAATGRSFTATQSSMTSGFGRIGNAANSVYSNVSKIGSGLSNAVSQLDTFSSGMLGLVGIMGSQQVYDATVGLANTFQGYLQFWNTAYGSDTASVYTNTVMQMQELYYSSQSVTAKTLQLLANTMPTSTSATDIASLTPMVQAYINFYKTMKPEFASLAEIEGPQDIAAVFSGNTGEIRASPLAQPLKEIAALPDEQKMAALKALFNDRGIMQFVSGLTAYDKEMNKFKSTLNELEIGVGTKLLPLFTQIMAGINEFVKSHKDVAEFAIILTGLIAVLATVGGVGSLAIQGLAAGWGIVTSLASGIGTLTARLLSAAGAEVVLGNATKAMSASNVQWGSTLRGVGASILSFLVSPMGIAVVAVGALVAAIIILGNKYGWFKSAVTKANDEMSRLNTQTSNASTRQSEAQQRVNELTNSLSQQAAGTPGWISTKASLVQAEVDLKNATSDVNTATAIATQYQKDLAEAQSVLAGSYQTLYRSYIAYQVSSGAMDPKEAQARLEAADSVTQGNYGTIASLNELSNANYNTASSYNTATSNTNTFGQAISNLPAYFTPLWNPLDRLKGYISSFMPGGETDPSKIDWSGFNPNKAFSLDPTGGKTGDLGVMKRIASFLGIDVGQGETNSTKPASPTPGVSYAANGGSKPGITEDIFGSKGILRGTGLESGGGINNLFKNFKFPTATQILNLFKPKIPSLKWTIPNVSQILTQTWQKITSLNWKIPNPQDFLMQTWYKISNLLWQIPGAGDFLGQTWQKIWELIWNPPTIDDIKAIIWQKIKDFVWPMGPAPAGGGSVGGGGGAFGPPPRGPINDTIVSAMSARSGVGSGYIASALSKQFNGVSAFNDIADGMAAPLSYEFYYGGQKTNQQVWDSGTCNCYDGAEFLQAEARQRFGLDAGLQNGLWDGTSIAHTWSVIGNRLFDMAAKLIRGQWAPPSGPLGLDFAQFMTDIGPGLEYMGYAGHAQDGLSALGGGGNCFDMSIGLMQIARDLFGLPAELMWGTYEGQSHVWPRIGNKEYDPTRRALAGTYNPPPRGPLKENAKEIHFHITNKFEKEVFGVEDFDARVKEQSKAGVLEILNKYFKPNAFG